MYSVVVDSLYKSFSKIDYKSDYKIPFLKKPKRFDALCNINFQIQKGSYTCLLGKNGSGKSTLLKCISNIYKPTSGSIMVNGRISPIIEVLSAFHEFLTGRENIRLFGLILGFNNSEIDNAYSRILSFSGLENFIDTQICYYSSGMKVRLAFSVISHLINDIVILDEVFSVGDDDFQKKSEKKIYEIIESKKTVIHVTHSLSHINSYVDRILLLNKGFLEKDISEKKKILEFKFN